MGMDAALIIGGIILVIIEVLLNWCFLDLGGADLILAYYKGIAFVTIGIVMVKLHLLQYI
jgi:hypothetical protein